MRLLIRVHTEQFILDDPETIERVRAEIEAAARTGGGFVKIGFGDAPEALITAATPVLITTIPDDDPEDYLDADAPATLGFVDLDSY